MKFYSYLALLPCLVSGLSLPNLVPVQEPRDIPEPPPVDKYAEMSRWLAHYNDYTSIATISSVEDIQGYPFTAAVSYADGIIGQSSGIPYFYITGRDISSQDLEQNPKATIALTMEQTGYCSKHKLDVGDPRCARLMLTGQIVKLVKGSDEEKFAKEALFSRHPAMVYWPANHGFYFTKLELESIRVIDNIGGGFIKVPLEDYFNASPN